MRHFCLLVSSIVVIGFAAGCAPNAQEPDPQALIAAAEELDNRFLAAVNSGDPDAIAACYADDAVTMPPDAMMANGKASIRESFSQMLASMPGVRLEMIESHHNVVGDAVVGYGLFRLVMPGPDGTELPMEGRFTDVKAERDGQWVYLVDHASIPLPPAEEGM